MLPDFDLAEIPVEFLPFFEPEESRGVDDARLTSWESRAYSAPPYNLPAPIRKPH